MLTSTDIFWDGHRQSNYYLRLMKLNLSCNYFAKQYNQTLNIFLSIHLQVVNLLREFCVCYWRPIIFQYPSGF